MKFLIYPVMKKKVFLFFTLTLLSCLPLMAQKMADNPNDTSFILKHSTPEFTIQFPNSYVLKESKVNNGLKSELFESEYMGDLFMLKFSEHKNPAVSGDNRMFMDASLDSFVTGIRGTLINKNDFKYLQNNGLEAYISLVESNRYVFYRVLIIDRVQYQIIVITKAKDKTQETELFFKSFNCSTN